MNNITDTTNVDTNAIAATIDVNDISSNINTNTTADIRIDSSVATEEKLSSSSLNNENDNNNNISNNQSQLTSLIHIIEHRLSNIQAAEKELRLELVKEVGKSDRAKAALEASLQCLQYLTKLLSSLLLIYSILLQLSQNSIII